MLITGKCPATFFCNTVETEETMNVLFELDMGMDA